MRQLMKHTLVFLECNIKSPLIPLFQRGKRYRYINMNKVLIEIKNNIGIITLNNPDKHNALLPEMVDALTKAYVDFDEDSDVHSILLHANGKHFSAGADLKQMVAMSRAPFEENLADAKTLSKIFNQIYACKKPTLCCVQGKTFGGGLGLIAASDIAIAHNDSAFCFSEVKLGLVPATITPFVVQRIGYQVAKYLMLTAELFDTEKALRVGFIDQVCDSEIALDAGLEIANALSKNNLAAMISTKAWLNKNASIDSSTNEEAATLLAKSRTAEETQKLIVDFLEKNS